MQQLTTVCQKYVTQMTNLLNPPLLKMCEIARLIDAPASDGKIQPRRLNRLCNVHALQD